MDAKELGPNREWRGDRERRGEREGREGGREGGERGREGEREWKGSEGTPLRSAASHLTPHPTSLL